MERLELSRSMCRNRTIPCCGNGLELWTFLAATPLKSLKMIPSRMKDVPPKHF
jgi:hypothetical protein